jgi:ferredoxin
MRDEAIAMSVRVVVDRNRCASVSMCLQLAPGSFELDAEGFSTFVGGADADVWELNEAAEGCPNAAITIEENV